MKPTVVNQLLAINRRFYEEVADPFAATRTRPQPGFARLLPHLPDSCQTVLDVGCGNGRFGQFLRQSQAFAYIGVDFTVPLLAKGVELLPDGHFQQGDMSQPGFLDGTGKFDLVVCLAAMQHVPGHSNRARLLQEMAAHLTPTGRLFLSNWQFLDSARQRRKLRDWADVGLEVADLEPQDHLLSWQGDGGLRYVCQIDDRETRQLAAAANLQVVDQFRSDGREGNLSLYTVLGIPSL